MSLARGAKSGRVVAAGACQPAIPAPPEVVRAAAHREIKLDIWIIIAFLYPLSQLVVFELVGQLYLIDLLAFPLLLLMLTMPDAFERLKRIWPILALLTIWLLGQITTDLIRGSDQNDYLRGWAKIGFFAAQITALWLWLPRRRAYFAAFALGLGIAAYFGVPEEFTDSPWKFGYDRGLILVSLGLLFFASLAFPRVRYLGPALMLAISFFLLLQAARSAFGIVFIAAIVVAVALIFGRVSALRRRLTGGVFAAMLLGGLAVVGGATTVYGYAVESGALGRDAYVKYRDQTSGEVPFILGGRTEGLVSLQAIADAPLVGHGSWARDPYYVGLHHAIKLRLGLPVRDFDRGKRKLIPTHSYLLGAWVEAGIAGGLFWLWVLSMPLLAMYQILKREEILAPLVAYSAIALVWSTAFSPFGSTERVIVAFQLVILAWAIRSGGRSITLFAPVREALRKRVQREVD